MTVFFVLATFLAFIVLDYALNRKKSMVSVPTVATHAQAPVLADAEHVNGFLTPANRSYHPGHSWLLTERRNMVRVGADEFAAALLGKIEKVELPRPGQWIRQGQKVAAFLRNGAKTEMVSPTEGEVLEVNSELIDNPATLRNDPYGKGWLMTVHVPDEENTSRNLVPKGLVREWMRDAVEQLYSRQPALAGAVAADGGRPAEDILAALPNASWKDVTAEFFLTV